VVAGDVVDGGLDQREVKLLGDDRFLGGVTVSDRDRLREELDRWFIEIGVTESGGEKERAALEAGFRMIEVGHPYEEALEASKRRWQDEERTN
jgi:hypothetical protein